MRTVRSSGLLRKDQWQFRKDVSLQPVVPIFKVPLKTVTTGCTETAVTNYHDSMSNSPAEAQLSFVCLYLAVLLTGCSFHNVIVSPFVSLYRHFSLHPSCVPPLNHHAILLFPLHSLPPAHRLGLNSANVWLEAISGQSVSDLRSSVMLYSAEW